LEICKQVSFEVESDLVCLNQVLAEFTKFDESWIKKKDWLQCQLALAEAFTNVVRHAHKNLPKDTLISINITLTKTQIKIKILDYGKPFDLKLFLENAKKKKTELSMGGRGLEILNKIADELISFRTEDDRNCLLIIKNLSL
jgi:serine/threonine-protein kinase RsbW